MANYVHQNPKAEDDDDDDDKHRGKILALPLPGVRCRRVTRPFDEGLPGFIDAEISNIEAINRIDGSGIVRGIRNQRVVSPVEC